MIAKRIPARKATSSASRLVRYVVNAKGGLDPRSWTRTADYILDNPSTNAQGEKVGGVRVTNCGTDDPSAATLAIEAIQAANTRSKNDKTYHLVFSFPPGEQPALDVLHDIEDELVAAIGYADHQRISAVHVDTDHLHVHVAINKVHPTGLQNIEPYYDKHRLMEACERLELKHDLQRTDHGLEAINERRNRIRLDPEQRPDDRDSRFRAYLRQSYDLALADPPKAKTLNGLRNLSGCGVARAAEGAAVLLPGDARDGVEQRGKEPADSLRRQGNGDRTDAGERGVAGRPADIEAHAGVETLAGYVSRDVAPAMRQATTWPAMHAVVAGHGLEIRARGAGLVIGEPSLGLWARASDCGRDLSMKALTSRLGPFEPGRGATSTGARARATYAPRPRQAHPSSAHLFAQYQRERQARIAARKAGLHQLRQEAAAKRDELRRWRATQRVVGKLGKGASRKAVSATVRVQAAALRAHHQKAAAEKRKRFMAETTLPTWNEWLVQRASSGDTDALAVLRAREERELRLRGDLLTADRADKARTVILDALKPVTRKDGAVSYKTADGGMVIDRSRFVQAHTATTGAAFVALTLAAQRFQGQALDVQGSDTFKAEVAQLAAIHKLDVRFADPTIEAARQAAFPATPERPTRPVAAPQQPAAAEPTKPEASKGKPTATATQAVTKWIAQRNETRDRVSSIDYTRLWSPSDAGQVTYQGRRKLEDGSEVLLLKRGSEMLVKPSTPRVVAKASKWKVGRAVQIDGRGRFIESSKTKGREL